MSNAWATKEFDLEGFMKSITYPPQGMTTNLARRQVKSASAPEREMLILRKALEILPIGIKEDDIIAGNYGPLFADEALMEAIRQADAEEYGKSEEFRVWDEDERIISGRYMLFGIYTPAHTCVDYGTILKKGLKDYERRIQERLAHPADGYGKVYLEMMLESVETVKMFSGRYAAVASQAARACADEKRKAELERMACALQRVPYEPADNLFEALQGMWMIHTVTPASERSWASISLGRMDKYLLPYYEKWFAEGNTESEADQLFCAFFRLLDSYGDGSCALNLGPDWNILSEKLIDIEKKMKLRAPIIAVRMDENTPDKIYGKLLSKDLFEIGQPTFYMENACKRAMKYRGMTEDYSVNSCMGNIVVGRELADMWGCCLNMNLPLELALNNGKAILGNIPESLQKQIDTVKPEMPESFDVIKKQYKKYIGILMGYVAHQNLLRAAWVALNRPNPFLSMLLDDCIKYGRDRAQAAVEVLGKEGAARLKGDAFSLDEIAEGSGARYHNVTVLAMGFAHAADSLSTIEELVFRRKKYTVADIMNAARSNYEGAAQELYRDMRECARYADGSDKANENASFVLNTLADAAEENYAGTIRYLPTCHTIDANVQFGNCVYASMDGRRGGEPFGKNAGAALSAIKNTPTDLMAAAAELPQYRYSGGVPIDIYVPRAILESDENREKLAGILKAYMKIGGMQVQVNSVSIDLLKKAYENPEEYPHVIVRKGGFSIYFTDMLKEVQKDMINRFEKEMSS